MDKSPAAGSTKYTQDQIRFVLDARTRLALEWKEVAARFSKKWGGLTTSNQVRHLYWQHAASFEWLLAAEKHPYADFTHGNFSDVKKRSAKKSGRWFVTAASPVSVRSTKGANLFTTGFAAVQTWCREVGGELVVLPMRAHMQPLQAQPAFYDPALAPHRKSFAIEYLFNQNLRALDIHLNPQQMSPLTGLYRVRGGRAYVKSGEDSAPVWFNQSMIIAHAKQDMEIVGTGNSTTPRMLHTTGAITLPEYLPNRIGSIAAGQHVLGGLIVETDGDKFWARQVQFAPDGSFFDIDGFKYSPSGRKKTAALALRPGDLHVGRESKEVLDSDERLSCKIHPKEVFVEDVFDGSSISHHTLNKRLSFAKRPFKTLEEELGFCRYILMDIAKKTGGNIVVVGSNHHDHLTRYLEEGRYLRDDNHELAHRMIVDMYDGYDPLLEALDPDGKYDWLSTEDDYCVAGVQMAGHGHIGANGARGSLQQLEKAYGAGMAGHSHTPAIRGKMFQVGHSSEKRHGYNSGISTWLNTRGVVWPSGQCQLVTVIDGRHCLDDQV